MILNSITFPETYLGRFQTTMMGFFVKLFSRMNVYLAHLKNDARKYPIHEGLQEVNETFFHKKILLSKLFQNSCLKLSFYLNL